MSARLDTVPTSPSLTCSFYRDICCKDSEVHTTYQGIGDVVDEIDLSTRPV